MRLLILALFGLLAACFAASSNPIGVPPTLELTEGYIRVQTDRDFDLSVKGDIEFQCSASRPCIDGACCNSDGMYLSQWPPLQNVLIELRLLRIPSRALFSSITSQVRFQLSSKGALREVQ